MYTLITTLTSNIWAIEPNFAVSIINEIRPIIAAARLQRQPEVFDGFSISAKTTEIVPYSRDYEGNESWDYAQKGFVASVPLRGVMTKHTQMCGPAGCEIIGNRIRKADAHKNCSGIIIPVESGGGQVTAITPIIEALSGCKKPTAIFIDDMAASAALMITPFADFIMAKNALTRIGSLGVMGVYENDEKQLEAEGIKAYSYYSKYSFNKNKTEMEALQGNGELLLNKVIDPICRTLLGTYAQRRGSKLRDSLSEFLQKVDAGKVEDIAADNVFSGEMFFAHECLPEGNGLIDAIGSIGQCADHIIHLSKSQTKINVQ